MTTQTMESTALGAVEGAVRRPFPYKWRMSVWYEDVCICIVSGFPWHNYFQEVKEGDEIDGELFQLQFIRA